MSFFDGDMRAIVKHEMIHYTIQTPCRHRTHGKYFHALADVVGLERKYRN